MGLGSREPSNDFAAECERGLLIAHQKPFRTFNFFLAGGGVALRERLADVDARSSEATVTMGSCEGDSVPSIVNVDAEVEDEGRLGWIEAVRRD